MTDIKIIGVIGAGQMGNGIAHVAALAGYDVILNDLSADRLTEAKATIARNMHRQAARGLIADGLVEPALSRIAYTTAVGDFAPVDLAIEAASENAEVKRAIFKDLCPVLKPEAMIASNTSSISITRLGASTDRPEQFIGLHFMNPVPLMKLVEVIR
nr:3-hydroxyacyl-CoA dehydrogenase NAD-binding domain-containing protein [Hyphomonadaceae bacterium]